MKEGDYINNESHWLQVSAYKLLEYYSSNIDMQNF